VPQPTTLPRAPMLQVGETGIEEEEEEEEEKGKEDIFT
jgi:hypothetical protein